MDLYFSTQFCEGHPDDDKEVVKFPGMFGSKADFDPFADELMEIEHELKVVISCGDQSEETAEHIQWLKNRKLKLQGVA